MRRLVSATIARLNQVSERRGVIGPRILAEIATRRPQSSICRRNLYADNDFGCDAFFRKDMRTQTTQLQTCIDRMLAGDDAYRRLLVDHAYERLRLLARKLLADYPGVRRWEQTDDVLQRAALRLWKSLDEVRPEDVRSFFGLAATQIRRELIDLKRHYYGPEGMGKKHATTDEKDGNLAQYSEKCDPTDDPVSLTEWTELHERAQNLPDEDREVFDLLYYHGLTQPEAAEILEISLRTLKRRWLRARQAMYDAFHGSPPGTD